MEGNILNTVFVKYAFTNVRFSNQYAISIDLLSVGINTRINIMKINKHKDQQAKEMRESALININNYTLCCYVLDHQISRFRKCEFFVPEKCFHTFWSLISEKKRDDGNKSSVISLKEVGFNNFVSKYQEFICYKRYLKVRSKIYFFIRGYQKWIQLL